MNHKSQTEDAMRIFKVEELVKFLRPVGVVVNELAQFPYDYLGHPFELTRSHVLNAIKLVEDNKLSLVELELWAETLDVRDDVIVVAKSDKEKGLIIDALSWISSPELSELKGLDLLRFIRQQLDQSSIS